LPLPFPAIYRSPATLQIRGQPRRIIIGDVM
jgi:hypothetical protein